MDTFIRLMPFLLQLMGIAERFIAKPKSGIEKKALVLIGAKAVVDGLEAVSTGGQKKTWQAIQTHVGEFVDVAAAVTYPKE